MYHPLPVEDQKAVTCIGSRTTPQDVLYLQMDLGAMLAWRGHTQRSGGAPGADQAFEDGWLNAVKEGATGRFEVYLPWSSFGRGERYYLHLQKEG